MIVIDGELRVILHEVCGNRWRVCLGNWWNLLEDIHVQSFPEFHHAFLMAGGAGIKICYILKI